MGIKIDVSDFIVLMVIIIDAISTKIRSKCNKKKK